MKKLILLFVVTIQTMVAMADVSGKCGDNLTWTYTESTQTLTIVGTGAITNFSSYIVVPWYSLRGVIKHVVIGDGVTSIGNYAFYDCGALVSVTIGNTVATIGYNAFFGCGALLRHIVTGSLGDIQGKLFSFGHLAHLAGLVRLGSIIVTGVLFVQLRSCVCPGIYVQIIPGFVLDKITAIVVFAFVF
jgi:hypothetical protein